MVKSILRVAIKRIVLALVAAGVGYAIDQLMKVRREQRYAESA